MKLTKELVNERLKDRGIELIDDYRNALTRSRFRCAHSHEWIAKPGDVLFGQGCRKCSDRALHMRTRDKVLRNLESRNIMMLDEYQSVKAHHRFQCEHDHVWTASVDAVVHKGSSCPVCFYDSRRLTTEMIHDRLKDSKIVLVGEYLGSVRRKQEFVCDNGHTFTSRINSIIQTKLCPRCSISDGGFSVDKPAHAYILRFEWGLKFGVSNFLEQRLNQHRLNGEFVVVMTQFFEQGQDALDWETEIKREHKGRFATQEQFPNGWTETLSLDKEQIIVESLSRVSSVLKVVKEGGFTSYEQADELAT